MGNWEDQSVYVSKARDESWAPFGKAAAFLSITNTDMLPAGLVSFA